MYACGSDYDAGFPAFLLGPEAYFGLYRRKNMIGVQGDRLFYVLEEVVDVLNETDEAERQAREFIDRERVFASVSDLRSGV
jgi:hypothetical protein